MGLEALAKVLTAALLATNRLSSLPTALPRLSPFHQDAMGSRWPSSSYEVYPFLVVARVAEGLHSTSTPLADYFGR